MNDILFAQDFHDRMYYYCCVYTVHENILISEKLPAQTLSSTGSGLGTRHLSPQASAQRGHLNVCRSLEMRYFPAFDICIV